MIVETTDMVKTIKHHHTPYKSLHMAGIRRIIAIVSRPSFIILRIGIELLIVICLVFGILLAGFENYFRNRVYPGVYIDDVYFGGKDRDAITTYFLNRNIPFERMVMQFTFQDHIATLSGNQLGLGFDATLSAQQAYLIGRSPYMLSNIVQKATALTRRIQLHPLFRLQEGVLKEFLTQQAQQFYIPVEEPLFSFNGGRVNAFKPAKNGRALNEQATEKNLYEALVGSSNQPTPEATMSIPLVVEIVHPTQTTDAINSFGIKELLGRGESYFRGSIPGRIYNIALAASRVNGVLVAPGTTFSFNATVGDISAGSGYKQAYVIKSGRTVLDDGGGVCQVSTTLFRATLDAGLPIGQRFAHSYRVGYYEQGGWGAGFDATVYSPTYDFTFTNDTPAHILVAAVADTANTTLVFELYGTSDGRVATTSKARVWDIRPAPPDVYQDDPTLPAGTIKQVDWAASGAKAAFDYRVVRNGEELINKTFLSNFQPWQAVYLKGTRN